MKGVAANSFSSPALDPFPSKLLTDYYYCSNNFEEKALQRYRALEAWFEAFDDPDVYHSAKDVNQLLDFKVILNLLRLIKYSKEQNFSNCDKVHLSVVEKVYEQANKAYQFVKIMSPIQNAQKLGIQFENKMKELKKRGNELMN